MTKPIIAVATLMLVEEGKLRRDDPVDALLPELAERRVLKRLAGPLDATVQFIGLPFAEAARLFDELLMAGLGVRTGAAPPVRNGAPVEAKGGDNGGGGTAMGDQGDDEGDQGRGIVLPGERGAFARHESAGAGGTAIALVALPVDGDVGLADLAPAGQSKFGQNTCCGSMVAT